MSFSVHNVQILSMFQHEIRLRCDTIGEHNNKYINTIDQPFLDFAPIFSLVGQDIAVSVSCITYNMH